MRFKGTFFILFFIVFSAFAQEGKDMHVTEAIDSVAVVRYRNMVPADSVLKKYPYTSNKIYPKELEANFQEKYKGEEFDYETIKPKESLWEKIQKRIQKLLEAIFGKMAPLQANDIAETVFRILAIIIIGLVLYFFISYLLNKNGNFIFGKKNKKVNIEGEELNENIHEINFPESIAQFERQKDYRSAVRYQYLFLLKKLTDKNLIAWNPEKTNKDYEQELKTPAMKENFSQLSYIFDYVWYGEFDIDEESYNNFRKRFSDFKI